MNKGKSRTTRSGAAAQVQAYIEARPSSSGVAQKASSTSLGPPESNVPRPRAIRMRDTSRETYPTPPRRTSYTLTGPGPSSSTPKRQGSFRSPLGTNTIGHSISPCASAVHLITPPPSDENDHDSNVYTKTKRPSRRRKSITSDREESEEVERVLYAGIHYDPPVFTDVPPRTTPRKKVKSLGRLLLWVIAVPVVVWVGMALVLLGQLAISNFSPTAPPVPLQYMAWSISSNAVYLRDAMQSMQPVQQIGQIEFNTMSVVRFAADVETIGNSPIAAERLREYAKLTETLRDSSSAMNVRASIAFRDMTRDLSKADKLLKKLYPRRADPTRPRNFEVEAQLLELLDAFHTTRLPTELRAVSSRFRDAGMVLRKVSDDVRLLEEDLAKNGNELAKQLEVIPSKSSLWMPNPVAQRRAELYRAVAASFERAKEVEGVFRQIEWALSAYARSLPLFQSLAEVTADHRVSNATFQGIINQIDSVMPQLQDLVLLYQS